MYDIIKLNMNIKGGSMYSYSDDSYAAMLLTLSLAPNKDEYARPLLTREYRDLVNIVRSAGMPRIGCLIGKDISALMSLLELPEEEAYRIFVLLSRSVVLSYSLEGFWKSGINIITEFEDDYPVRLKSRAGLFAPPVLFVFGDANELAKPAIGITGISGVATTPKMRSAVDAIERFARESGYRIMTGGEHGVSRAVENSVLNGKSRIISALAGGLTAHLSREEIQKLSASGRLTAVSSVHPGTEPELPQFILRNRLLFSLCEAVFVFTTDNRRGEADAIRSRLCDNVYAYSAYEPNLTLIRKGAAPFDDLGYEAITSMSGHWPESRSEQLSLFDLI